MFSEFHPLQLSEIISQRISASQVYNDPLPHIIIDNLLPDKVAKICSDEIEQYGQPTDNFIVYNDIDQSKKLNSLGGLNCLPPQLFDIATAINTSSVLRSIQEKLLIDDILIPDPYLEGGGIHKTSSGGYLGMHRDFQFHPVSSLVRRVNLIIYFNRNWLANYNGSLSLRSNPKSTLGPDISPNFNRVVVFRTDKEGFHGFPQPIICPADVTRKSFALYFYSASISNTQDTTTIFFTPRHVFKTANLKLRLQLSLRKLLPPIFYDFIHTIRKIM